MIKELDVIRTKVPLEGPDVFDAARILPLPVGAEGTVVCVFGRNEAFEVEFLVYDNPAQPDEFTSVQIPVKADQCELAWVAPA